MKVRYRYRCTPTAQQRQLLAQLFGCVRVVWNDALRLCKQSTKLPSTTDLQKVCITKAKQAVDRVWLADVSNIPLQQSVQDLGLAFSNFFKSRNGKRKGPKMNPPAFKRKGNRQSARFTRTGFSIRNGKVYLAKVGELAVNWSRPLPSVPSSVTIVKEVTGEYYLSFVVEVEPDVIPAKHEAIGIDLGIKTFATLSTGEKVDAPNSKRLDRKIRRHQRRFAKRMKGSKRREAMRLKVAKLKAKERNVRKDFLHKLSTRIVRENQVIVLEDLNVSGLLKNRRLSRAISKAGWREFRTMCSEKAVRYDRDFRTISRWEPTSQVCSCCGYRWGKLDLSVREVVCMSCGTHHDRDENAAINIKQVGAGHVHDSFNYVLGGTGMERKTGSPAIPVEPSTRLIAVQLNLFAS